MGGVFFFTCKLRIANPITSTMTDSVDPDEISHKGAFHQDLHCLSRHNLSSEIGIQYFFEYIKWTMQT